MNEFWLPTVDKQTNETGKYFDGMRHQTKSLLPFYISYAPGATKVERLQKNPLTTCTVTSLLGRLYIPLKRIAKPLDTHIHPSPPQNKQTNKTGEKLLFFILMKGILIH